MGKIDPENLKELELTPVSKPDHLQAFDSDGYPIDYAVFRNHNAPDSACPTVLLIPGGPHVFIEYSDEFNGVKLFNDHGYHVVIPQGLFRRGYSPLHGLKGKGRMGEGDMEQLRCVMRDLLRRNISSQGVYLMGSSYGGYASARLAHDSDLVKAAFVGNAFLDLDSGSHSFNSENNQFHHVEGEDTAVRERRLRLLSPALEAPLPRVPVFMVGVQNDVRCPIAQSREFAHRLKERGLPFTYLEYPMGGHDHQFSYLEQIKAFFEGQRGFVCPEGYQIMGDTNGFYKT